KHIQKYININNFNKDDIQVSCKINSCEQVIALDEDDDYNALINKFRQWQKLEKLGKLYGIK
ncbi:7809_t:CDS:1, partial [Gigaspora margarita]